MKKSFLLCAAMTLTALLPVSAQEDEKGVKQLLAQRERLVKIVLDLESDFSDTLKDYSQLQQDYAKLLNQPKIVDQSGRVRELEKQLKSSVRDLASLRQTGEKQSKASATHIAQLKKKLQTDLSKLQDELYKERKSLLVAKTQVAQLKKLEKETASLRKALSKESIDRAETLGRLQAVRGERDALLGRLKEAMKSLAASEKGHREALARVGKLEQQTATLKKQLGERDAEIKRLRKAEAQGAVLTGTITSLTKEKASLTSQLASRQKELTGLRQDLASEQKRSLDVPVLVKARKELEARLATTNQNLKKTQTELTAQSKLAAEVPGLKKANATLLQQQAALTKDVAASKEKVVTMQKALDQNRDALAKAEKLGLEVTALTTERTKLTKDLAAAKTSLKTTETALAGSQKKVAEASALAALVPELKKKNSSLLKTQSEQKAQVDKVMANIATMQTALAENKKAAATAEKLGQEVSTLKTQRETLQQNLGVAKVDLNKAHETLATTEVALKASRAKTMEAAMAANNAKMELHEATKELTLAKDALQEVRGKIAAAQKAADEAKILKKTNADLLAKQKTLTAKQQTLTANLAKNAEAMKLASQLGKDKKALEVERKNLQSSLATAKKEIGKMTFSNATYQNTVDDLGTNLASLKAEKQKLTREVSLRGMDLASLRQELKENDNSAEVAKLAEEKNKLAADLKKARSELGQLHLNSAVMEKKLGSLKRRVATIDPVRYAKGAANVAEQQNRVLTQVRDVLNFFPAAQFEIVGHTCDLGSNEGNLKLSQERAQALRDFLISKGVKEDLLKARGVADAEPVAPNTSEANRSKNRRVEVQILD